MAAAHVFPTVVILACVTHVSAIATTLVEQFILLHIPNSIRSIFTYSHPNVDMKPKDLPSEQLASPNKGSHTCA